MSIRSLTDTTHRVEIRFALPGPLIQEEALGTEYTYGGQDDVIITLKLPAFPREFYQASEKKTVYVPALSPEQASMENTPRIWALNVIRLTVDFQGRGSMHDKATMPYEALEAEVGRSWQKGVDRATEEVTRFVAWLRVETGQSWLGTGDEASMQYGNAYVREAGQEGFLIAYGEEQSLTIRHGGIGISVEDLSRIRTRLAENEDVPPELELFADARFFARESDLIDGQRAVLAAAMAAEIAAKKAILRRTSEDKRPVVELLLKKTSNVVDLVSSIAKASLDRSMKDEDPELLKQLRQLTDLRNQIVHTGRKVDRDTAYKLSFAVGKLLAWLQ